VLNAAFVLGQILPSAVGSRKTGGSLSKAKTCIFLIFIKQVNKTPNNNIYPLTPQKKSSSQILGV